MLPLLSGFTIGVTADRRSDEQISMLTGRGAECLHGPVIRTHPLRPEAEVQAATEAFLCDPPDIVLLTTGIGVRGWLEAADSLQLGEQVRAVLGRATLLSRGPKAKGAAVTAGLEVAWSSPSATSDELLAHVATLEVVGKRIAVQLDGAPPGTLPARLEALGATTLAIPVYRWSMPGDTKPAERLIRAVVAGQVDAVTFTARPAVENFAAIATAMGCLDEVVSAFASTTSIFCVGPVCAAGVIEIGLGQPFSPDQFRLGSMITTVTKVLAQQALVTDVAGYQVTLQGRMVSVGGAEATRLTGRERQVLDVLLERPGVVHSKTALLQSVWGQTESDPHVVEVTIGRLRQRLGVAGEGIETVVRRGYRASAQ